MPLGAEHQVVVDLVGDEQQVVGGAEVGDGAELVAACGGNTASPIDASAGDAALDAGVDPNEGARSGSRLKLTWFEFSDGTRQWNSFYDAERKEGCYPYPAWTDGHGRLVSRPVAPAEATTRVVMTGTGVALATGALVLVGGHLMRMRVERRATLEWGVEWDRIDRRRGHTTG